MKRYFRGEIREAVKACDLILDLRRKFPGKEGHDYGDN